jgi:hypothetical protein
MLATITGHNPDIVEKAIKIFVEFGLIQILDSGAIYVSDIQNFIGASSTEADRVRAYRSQIDNENKMICTNVQQTYNKCTPEIDIEIDIEKEIDINITQPQPAVASKKSKRVDTFNFSKEFEDAFAAYPHRQGDGDAKDKQDTWRKWTKIIQDKSAIDGVFVDEEKLLDCVKNYIEERRVLSREAEWSFRITNFFGRASYYKKYLIKKPIKLNEVNNGTRNPNHRTTATEHHAAVVRAIRDLPIDGKLCVAEEGEVAF